MTRISASGHSRGGKLVYMLARDYGDKLGLMAICGIDPVDGGSRDIDLYLLSSLASDSGSAFGRLSHSASFPPKEHERITNSPFTFRTPTLTIGCGIGPTDKMSSNPVGFNYEVGGDTSPKPSSPSSLDSDLEISSHNLLLLLLCSVSSAPAGRVIQHIKS